MPKYRSLHRHPKWIRRKKKVFPARIKINPRISSKFTYGSTSTTIDDGVPIVARSMYSCLGISKRIEQGARVNLLGSYVGFKGSYCAVSIKTSTGVSVPGKLVGSIINTTTRKWMKYVVEGDIAASSRYFSTITMVGVADEKPPERIYKDYATHLAYAKLGSPKSDVGMMIGEIGETFRFMVSPLQSLRKFSLSSCDRAVKIASKQKYKNFFDYYLSFLGALSDTWLEYRYAITPMLIDIDDLMNIAATGLLELSDQIHIVKGVSKGTSVEPVSVMYDLPHQYGGRSVNCYWKGEKITEQTSCTRIFFKDKTYMEAARNLHALGISPLQWPALAYQLVPGSFIVDWFFGLGKWLEAIAPKPQVEVLGSCCSTKLKTTWNLSLDTVAQASYAKWSIEDVPKFSMSTTNFIREKNPSFNALPVLNPSMLSLKRRIDSIALIYGNLPKKLTNGTGILESFKKR